MHSHTQKQHPRDVIASQQGGKKKRKAGKKKIARERQKSQTNIEIHFKCEINAMIRTKRE